MGGGKLSTAVVLCLFLFTMSTSTAVAEDKPTTRPTAVSGWPKEIKDISFPSNADKTKQPALFYAPPKRKKPTPLLVGLHSWSGGYKQTAGAAYAKWCIKKGWAFIHPHFRGPNRTPRACGSELVVKDILSAVAYAKTHAKVDVKRIYLVGSSGGGHAALLMAGRAPKVWAGVSAWVPISDLTAWYHECKKAGRGYFRQIAKSCGGAPGKNAKVDAEYRQRSPLTHLTAAKDVFLDINAGISDGHKGSVPISHSLNAYNLLAAKADRIAAADVAYLTKKAKVPEHLAVDIKDPTYGRNKPLFRRTSGKVRVTIFKGGHQIVHSAAFAWLESLAGK